MTRNATLKLNRGAALAARWVLGLVFIVFALGKVLDPAGFANNVAAYRILPLSVVNVFALMLAWTEMLVGLSLLNGTAYRSGALLAAVLNAMFIVVVFSAMIRGLNIECGCFSIARETVGWSLLIRDTVFLALAIVVLFSPEANGT